MNKQDIALGLAILALLFLIGKLSQIEKTQTELWEKSRGEEVSK